jgi:hypothetical protein
MATIEQLSYRRISVLRPTLGNAFDLEMIGTPVAGAFLRVHDRQFTTNANGLALLPAALQLLSARLEYGLGEEVYSEILTEVCDPDIPMLLFMGNAPLAHNAAEIILQPRI